MERIKKYLKQKLPFASYFGSSSFELKQFFPESWICEFQESSITFKSYPFECASVFSKKKLSPEQILGIDLNSFPCAIFLQDEVLFVEKNHRQNLRTFMDTNNINSHESISNWEEILDDFLDNELSDERKKNALKLLNHRGIPENEVISLRREVEKQMLKYNFDTMMWEWCVLGLYDVLCAMRPSLSAAEFSRFYLRAMEIEYRGL